MTCRSCGAAIDDKAIVCYRCGAATADAASLRPTRPSPRRVWPLMVAIVVIIVAVGYYFLSRGH